jgi:hypothetical protein
LIYGRVKDGEYAEAHKSDERVKLFTVRLDTLPRRGGILGDRACVVEVPEEGLYTLLISPQRVDRSEVAALFPVCETHKRDAV